MGEGTLWAITSYFNPAGFRVRGANYREFRQRLGIPLFAIELAFGNGFELGPDDADILVQIQGRDVMWQKERLLNVAIRHLPPECDRVAWIDADVVFDRPDWPRRLDRALERFPLVQLMSEACDLPRGFDLADLGAVASLPRIESTASRVARGVDVCEGLRRPAHRSAQASANGLAWAARRDLIEAHGFYDACILGSGDRAMVGAALGHSDAVADALLMNAQQRRHYDSWAKPFHESVDGRIGCLAGTIHHLWHGQAQRRKLATRYRVIEPHGFDPSTDLVFDAAGAWAWGSDKPVMHQVVSDYFRSRREDD